MLAIGLMSGTSLDGVDAALIETDGEAQVRALAFRSEPYSDAARAELAEATALALTFERDLNPRTSLQAGVRWGNQDFTDEGDEADLLEAEISLDRTFGQRITLGISVEYYDRDSDSGFDTRSYDEWLAAISFRYQLFGTLN